MRKALFIAACLVIFEAPAYPATIQQDIAEAERLNDLCRGGSGDNPATAKHCERRDTAYAAIESRGWCWGHDGQVGYQRQWERCQPPASPSPETEPKPYSSVFLAMNKDLMLREQRQQCQDMGIASGNPKGAARCIERQEKAYLFMRNMAHTYAIPLPVWAICTEKAYVDIDLGARCIAAGKEICKADENGTAIDYSQCVRIMSNGAWVTNPAARAVRF